MLARSREDKCHSYGLATRRVSALTEPHTSPRRFDDKVPGRSSILFHLSVGTTKYLEGRGGWQVSDEWGGALKFVSVY